MKDILPLLLEVGLNKLPGLTKIDLLFEQLKKSKTNTEDTKLCNEICKNLKDIFGCDFFMEIHYSGSFNNNCGVIWVYSKDKNFEIIKNPKNVSISGIKIIHIVIGNLFIEDNSAKELTAVILHEIGHVVNHLNDSLSHLLKSSSENVKILHKLNTIPIIRHLAYPFLIIFSRTLAYTSHIAEYNADKFTIEYGYGDEMISQLKKYKAMNESSPLTLRRLIYIITKAILGSTHPNDEDRIKAILLQIKNNYIEQYKSKRIKELINEYYPEE